MGGISILAMLAVFGLVFLFVAGTLLLVFLGTGIPLLVLAIRRRLGHRSRASKIAMIVLGIVCGVAFVLLAAIFVFLVLPILAN